jgi:excisionase family DNA binding protein
MERLLNIDELSDMLGVTKATIYSWTSQNKIPHIKLSKRLLKFREGDIVEWISKRSFNANSSHQKLEMRKSKVPGAYINPHDECIERFVRNAKEEVLN